MPKQGSASPGRLGRGFCPAFFLALSLASAAGTASAAVVTWNNPGTGDWFAAGNWSGGVPGSGDDARVNNGGEVVNSTGPAAQARTLSIGANAAAPGVTGARGTVRLGAAGLQLGPQLLVGFSLNNTGSSLPFLAEGQLTVAGALRLEPQPGFTGSLLNVGVAEGGVALGQLRVGSLDTTAGPVGNLKVGDAERGRADGLLQSAGGQLQVVGNAVVGRADSDTGAAAVGRVVLEHAMTAGSAGTVLSVGTLTGGGFAGLGTGRADGSLTATALDSFESIVIGRSTVHRAVDAAATAELTVGAAGIRRATVGGSFTVGEAAGSSSNGLIFGAASATGRATVAGDILGYGTVNVGRVLASGVADGALTLNGGALQTQALRVGAVQGNTLASVVDGRANAQGLLQLSDASASTVTAQVGTVFNANPGVEATARGELNLTRSQFDAQVLQLGQGEGGHGVAKLSDNSEMRLNGLTMAAGPGTRADMQLSDSRLAVSGLGVTSLGSAGGTASLDGLRSTVQIAGNLVVTGGSSAADGSSVRLKDSVLSVDGGVEVRAPLSAGRTELTLDNSSATVGGDLRLGAFQPGFGEALLALDASLLSVAGGFTSGLGSTMFFGLDGLSRGLGGYGALDAASVVLAGLLHIDLSELDLGLITGPTQDFDLIVATGAGGIVGDFNAVSLFGSLAGFDASFGKAGLNEEIWRLTLSRLDSTAVPEPSSLALVLVAVLAARSVRGRHKSRQPC
jgi:hypothetical protein